MRIQRHVLRIACVLALLTASCGPGADSDTGTGAAEPEGVEATYVRYCAACHGVDGRTVAGSPAPHLNSQGLLALADDELLRASVTLGRPGPEGRGRPGVKMPAYAERERGPLGDSQIDELVAYMRAWQTVPSIELDPSWQAEGDPAAGARIYARDCGSCHGPEGWAPEAPRLAGSTLQAYASDDFIRQTVLRGREGTTMPAFPYSDDQVEDLTTFVVGLGGAGP